MVIFHRPKRETIVRTRKIDTYEKGLKMFFFFLFVFLFSEFLREKNPIKNTRCVKRKRTFVTYSSLKCFSDLKELSFFIYTFICFHNLRSSSILL